MTKENPQLDWMDGYIPVSRQFDDPYYSKIDGRAETRHVFIGGNNLLTHARAKKELLVGELGFGTGLNFIETWRWFMEEKSAGTIPDDCRLSFVSFELYPMAAEQMKTALAHWPELSPQADRLLEKWNNGGEAFCFSPGGDISLRVHFGDANLVLPTLSLNVAAWYLDGFAPSRNPELWGLELLKEVRRNTAPNGTFATYTVAGWVRRNLESAGFDVSKAPGFASKREMLTGKAG